MARSVKRDPLLTCFTLCDRVYHDEISRKWGAMGLYNSLTADTVPMGVLEMWFFCRIADAPREIAMKGSIVSPSGLVIAECTKHFSRTDTQQGGIPGVDGWWEIGGRFKEVMFTAYGRYSVEMAVNGVTLGETALYIVKPPKE